MKGTIGNKSKGLIDLIQDSKSTYKWSSDGTTKNIDNISTAINKTNINKPDSNGCTPLYWAVSKGREDVVDLLLKKSIELNVELTDFSNPGLTEVVHSSLELVLDKYLGAQQKFNKEPNLKRLNTNLKVMEKYKDFIVKLINHDFTSRDTSNKFAHSTSAYNEDAVNRSTDVLGNEEATNKLVEDFETSTDKKLAQVEGYLKKGADINPEVLKLALKNYRNAQASKNLAAIYDAKNTLSKLLETDYADSEKNLQNLTISVFRRVFLGGKRSARIAQALIGPNGNDRSR
jgi:Ankyrin repeat